MILNDVRVLNVLWLEPVFELNIINEFVLCTNIHTPSIHGSWNAGSIV